MNSLHGNAFKMVRIAIFLSLSIFLTACPELSWIRQQRVATVGTTITVDVGIRLDTIQTQGAFYMDIPDGFIILGGYFPNINKKETFEFNLESDGMACGGDTQHWYAHLDNRLQLGKGLHTFRIKIRVGETPGDYDIYYHLGAFWGEGQTESIKVVEPLQSFGYNGEATYNVFPNPATDILRVSHPGVNEFLVQLLNSNGTTLAESRAFNGASTIDLSSVPDGVYIIKLGAGKISTTRKIIVKH